MRAMTECPVARNSTGWTLLRETSDVPLSEDETAKGNKTMASRAVSESVSEWSLSW